MAKEDYELWVNYHMNLKERRIKDYFEFTSNNPLYEKLNNNTDLNYIINI